MPKATVSRTHAGTLTGGSLRRPAGWLLLQDLDQRLAVQRVGSHPRDKRVEILGELLVDQEPERDDLFAILLSLVLQLRAARLSRASKVKSDIASLASIGRSLFGWSEKDGALCALWFADMIAPVTDDPVRRAGFVLGVMSRFFPSDAARLKRPDLEAGLDQWGQRAKKGTKFERICAMGFTEERPKNVARRYERWKAERAAEAGFLGAPRGTDKTNRL